MLQISIIILVAFVFNFAACNHTVKWKLAEFPEVCAEKHLCTPSGLTWPSHEEWNYHRSCKLFSHANISKIMFWGDSYMRHIFMATVLMFSENYKNGALLQKTDRKFYYWRQFDSANKFGNINSWVGCNESLTLSFAFAKAPKTCDPHELHLWSEGNHPTWYNYDTRGGVNNYTEYISKFLRPDYGICNKFLSKVESCNLYWISTHARYSVVFPDETPEIVKDFNVGMRKFIEDKKCGNKTGYIDVFNMTESLMINHHPEATFMTEDFMHWGLEVNLIKIQIIMQTLHHYFKLYNQIPHFN